MIVHELAGGPRRQRKNYSRTFAVAGERLYEIMCVTRPVMGSCMTVRMFDLVTCIWVALQPMSGFFCGAAAIEVNRELWLVGGTDDSGEPGCTRVCHR